MLLSVASRHSRHMQVHTYPFLSLRALRVPCHGRLALPPLAQRPHNRADYRAKKIESGNMCQTVQAVSGRLGQRVRETEGSCEVFLLHGQSKKMHIAYSGVMEQDETRQAERPSTSDIS
jgi:hypothetical protein